MVSDQNVFSSLSFGREGRAPYAVDHTRSNGRFYDEPSSPTRTEYQRDRDRIIHSTAFRRLKHKTQVFIYHEGDHFRTRLTHTIEVAQIARSIARALRLDEDLAEALALAHDLGHTPFGHAGEDAMQVCMSSYGGFEHNAQTLRIITQLERHYAEFDGLNLTWETLEGIAKHNGPLTNKDGVPIDRYAEAGLPYGFTHMENAGDLKFHTFASLEAQAAAVADDIAYNAHDIDDGLRAGLFTLQDLKQVPFFAGILGEIEARYPALDDSRTAHELVRRIITRLIEDVILTGQRSISRIEPQSVEDVRNASQIMISFSDRMAADERAIKSFLFDHMYRTPHMNQIREGAQSILVDLFEAYFSDPLKMSNDWAADLKANEGSERARRVCDYVAGMTDRYAFEEHKRLFDATPELS